MMRGWRAWCLGGLALVAAAGHGQTGTELPDVAAPLPAVPMPAWRIAGEYDWATEYTVELPSPLRVGPAVNHVIPLRVFIPEGSRGPHRLVLIAHYWGANDLRSEVSLAQELAKRNIASAVLTLPYHLQRTPPGERSGALAIQPDPQALRETTLQSALDFRRTLDYLLAKPEFRSDRVGIAGTSLGAIVSALVFSVEPRVTDAAFILGGIDLAGLLWQSSRVVPQRDALRAKGVTLESLRESLRPVEPAARLPRPASFPQNGQALVIVGKFDTVVPGPNSQLLIDRIPGAHRLEIDTGHYGGIFVQRRLLRETASFFGEAFADRDYVPPTRFYAPTIRLGVSLQTQRGLEVGGGLDLFALDRAGRWKGTAFISPSGPQLWIHRGIGAGFSVGAVGSLQRVGVGLMWSTVL
ncbi:MAG: hypothetical protein SFX74_08745 [Fimbriimonadaceae bacterium]|nr:hypothetical protein [Fimbriimonadaceae bacterium]